MQTNIHKYASLGVLSYLQIIIYAENVCATLKFVHFMNYSYAAMYPAGLLGAVRSRQVHQLTQGTGVGCSLLNVI